MLGDGAGWAAELLVVTESGTFEHGSSTLQLPVDAGAYAALTVTDTGVDIVATTRTADRTGVEMEALTGATVAALTVYDMCKALSHRITIGPAKLLSKQGGKHAVGKTVTRKRSAGKER